MKSPRKTDFNVRAFFSIVSVTIAGFWGMLFGVLATHTWQGTLAYGGIAVGIVAAIVAVILYFVEKAEKKDSA